MKTNVPKQIFPPNWNNPFLIGLYLSKMFFFLKNTVLLHSLVAVSGYYGLPWAFPIPIWDWKFLYKKLHSSHDYWHESCAHFCIIILCNYMTTDMPWINWHQFITSSSLVPPRFVSKRSTLPSNSNRLEQYHQKIILASLPIKKYYRKTEKYIKTTMHFITTFCFLK